MASAFPPGYDWADAASRREGCKRAVLGLVAELSARGITLQRKEIQQLLKGNLYQVDSQVSSTAQGLRWYCS
jgi:hypothetical protein